MTTVEFSEKISRKQRKRIKERDGNHCVACWRKYDLTIHHHHDFTGTIKPRYSSTRYNFPYNNPRDCDLVTLCKHCHGKVQVCDKGSPFYQLVTNYLTLQKEGKG